MAPLTALAFVCAGGALFASTLSATLNLSTFVRWTRLLGAGMLVLISSTRLLACMGVANFHMDRLIFAGESGGDNPATMSPATACSFLLLAVGLLLPEKKGMMPWFQTFTLIGGLASWLGLNFFLFGGEPLPVCTNGDP